MLRRLKNAPAGRLALCLAAVLAVVASFGLHPEPADALASGSTESRFASTMVAKPSHGCLACLTHGAALAALLSNATLGAAAASPAPTLPRAVSHGPLFHQELTGRSPPPARS